MTCHIFINIYLLLFSKLSCFSTITQIIKFITISHVMITYEIKKIEKNTED